MSCCSISSSEMVSFSLEPVNPLKCYPFKQRFQSTASKTQKGRRRMKPELYSASLHWKESEDDFWRLHSRDVTSLCSCLWRRTCTVSAHDKVVPKGGFRIKCLQPVSWWRTFISKCVRIKLPPFSQVKTAVELSQICIYCYLPFILILRVAYTEFPHFNLRKSSQRVKKFCFSFQIWMCYS